MKVVTPYQQFRIESPPHKRLGEFDWIAAIRMLRHSVEESNPGVQVHVITDKKGSETLPGPCHGYGTSQNRLMLWILEVSLAYLSSDDFDQDTIMISPDMLVFGDLKRWWGKYDAGFLWRGGDKKFANAEPGQKILNGVQFWRRDGKARLIEFYRKAYELGQALPEDKIKWGADTIALERALRPMQDGTIERSGIRAKMIDADSVIQYLPTAPDPMGKWLPDRIVDFKFLRKLDMQTYFDMLFKPNEAEGFVFPKGDRFMASQVRNGGYQRSHLDRALAEVKKFRTAIDGGAHVGTWSVPMAKRFERVLAFEPSLDTFNALKANLASHNAANVEVFYNALGKKERRVRMTLDGFDKAIDTGNLGARFVGSGDDVEMITLDKLGLTDVDFIKLDVEGSEVIALIGAKQTLLRCKPVVLFEDKNLWKRYGYGRLAPQEFLASLGARKVTRISMDEIWSW